MGGEINPNFNLDANHHSVPKFYLKQWANAHNLVKVTRVSDQSVSYKSPKSLTASRNFYTATFSDGRKDSSAEQIFSSIENDAIRVFRSIMSEPIAWPPSDYDKVKLCAFTAYQATRVTKYKDAVAAVLEAKLAQLESSFSSLEIDKTNLHIQAIAAASDPYALDLLRQNMGLFITSERVLNTSDNPVIRNVNYLNLQTPLTSAFPIRSTLIPLNPSMLLAFFGDAELDCTKPFTLTTEMAEHLNQLQRNNAQDFIYSVGID